MSYREVWKGLAKGQFGLACMLIVGAWAGSAFFLPWWGSLLSLLLIVVGVALLIGCAALPELAPRRQTDSPQALTDEQIKAMREEADKQLGGVNQTVSALQQKLGRWFQVSQHAHGDLLQVHDGVHEVMIETESAVVNIANSFRGIIKKTAVQIEYAVRLLKSTDSGGERGLASWLGLPDYIHAYEAQLQHVTMRMMEFSATFKEVAMRQANMRESTIAVDELLDELRAMAKRIGTLAVDSSFHASSATVGQSAVISLSDKIRTIAEEAHELTRRIRNNLETIKGEMAGTYKAVRDSSTAAQVAAEQAKADVSQLNVTMMEKTKEVENTFEKINTLGKEIQDDINKIIMAMQFQDITQQKLEKLKQPKLTGVIKTLQEIAEEVKQAGNKTDSTSDTFNGSPATQAQEGATLKKEEAPKVPDSKHSELF
ncbi:MAG: hypothetical protein Q7S51_02025 [Gallionellaceae bacterium]|nr:hypothetical protein [Gallionellaceae bacterium]